MYVARIAIGFQRVEINRKVVQEAFAVAASKAEGVHVWADTQLRYLTIRVRCSSARWTVRALKTMRALGDLRERHPQFLSVADARKAAKFLGQTCEKTASTVKGFPGKEHGPRVSGVRASREERLPPMRTHPELHDARAQR